MIMKKMRQDMQQKIVNGKPENVISVEGFGKELRIGNILSLLNDEPVEISVDSIKEITSGVHPYEKIPLTEEWLLIFGAEHISDRFYLKRSDFNDNKSLFLRYETYNNNWEENENGWLLIGDWEGFNITPILYVHQLQNIYFAITGNELKIKNDK